MMLSRLLRVHSPICSLISRLFSKKSIFPKKTSESFHNKIDYLNKENATGIADLLNNPIFMATSLESRATIFENGIIFQMIKSVKEEKTKTLEEIFPSHTQTPAAKKVIGSLSARYLPRIKPSRISLRNIKAYPKKVVEHMEGKKQIWNCSIDEWSVWSKYLEPGIIYKFASCSASGSFLMVLSGCTFHYLLIFSYESLSEANLLREVEKIKKIMVLGHNILFIKTLGGPSKEFIEDARSLPLLNNGKIIAYIRKYGDLEVRYLTPEGNQIDDRKFNMFHVLHKGIYTSEYMLVGETK